MEKFKVNVSRMIICGVFAVIASVSGFLYSQQGKPILLIFTASWCPPCNQMKKEVYPNVDMTKYDVKFIDINDLEQARAVKYYKVDSIPKFVIVQYDGRNPKIIRQAEGYQPAPAFQKFLDGTP